MFIFFSITTKRLVELSSLIVSVFPTEIQTTYYVPYSRFGKKKLLAKGKLQVRYNHYRNILLLSGATKNHKGIKRKAVDESALVCVGTAEDIFQIGIFFLLNINFYVIFH